MTRLSQAGLALSLVFATAGGAGIARAVTPTATFVAPPHQVIVKAAAGTLIRGTPVTVPCPATAPAIQPASSDGTWSVFVNIAGPLVQATVYPAASGGFELQCTYTVKPNQSAPVSNDGLGTILYNQGVDPRLGNCKSAGVLGPITCTPL